MPAQEKLGAADCDPQRIRALQLARKGAQSVEMKHNAIRLARTGEEGAIGECVSAAYRVYIERIGKKPAPMLADYAALIARGVVYVIVAQSKVRGVLVMWPKDDRMFVENIAVHPRCQRRGLGRKMIEFVERRAVEMALSKIWLYTNETMTENIAYYHKLGFEEVDRRVEDGYRRVFMQKKL